MLGWSLVEPETEPVQLALDVGGLPPEGEDCRAAAPDNVAPTCGHCCERCPWTSPDDDELSWHEWFDLLPTSCKRSTTKT